MRVTFRVHILVNADQRGRTLNDVMEEDNLYKLFCKEIYEVVKKFVSEREMSAQEAALDATSLPLIEFSRQFVPVQVNNPQEMKMMVKPESRRKDDKDFFYSLPITKYIHRMSELFVKYELTGPVGVKMMNGEQVDFDNMCMFEFFASYIPSYSTEPDGRPGVTRVKKRVRKAVVVPTPYRKDNAQDEDWAYQTLMLFLPFRSHSEVLVHPTGRELHREGEDYDYIEEQDGVLMQSLFEDVDDEGFLLPIPERTEHFGPAGPNSATPYPTATSLLLAIIDDPQYWPEELQQRRERAVVLEQALRNQMNGTKDLTPEDMIEWARQHNQLGDDGFTVEEITDMCETVADIRDETKLTADPDYGAFHGPSATEEVKKSIAEVTKKKAVNYTQVYSREVFDEERQLDTRSLLNLLNEELESVANNQGIKVRQKAVLLALGAAIQDILREQLGLAVRNPRTCRLILQGEAGTGKTYVLCKAEDMCMKYLGRRSVRSFAPTANACKNYANGSTMHRVFHKAVMQKGKRSAIDVNSSNLEMTESVELTNEMRGVYALIGDEMSMMSPADIDLIDKRMQEALKVDIGTDVRRVSIELHEY